MKPEALPKDGNLRGATMRTAMGSYHLRPFGAGLQSKAISAGALRNSSKTPATARWPHKSIDEIAALLGNDFSPPI